MFMLFQPEDEISEYLKLLNLIEALIFQTKISNDSKIILSRRLMREKDLHVEWKVNIIKLLNDIDIPLSSIKELIILLKDDLTSHELFSIYYKIHDQKKIKKVYKFL